MLGPPLPRRRRQHRRGRDHGQVHPGELLNAVQHAEQARLGAAPATTRLRFGVVNPPGQRYHPVIIAQAAATLAAMFLGRFWTALGFGRERQRARHR